jgi:hypothetical protein
MAGSITSSAGVKKRVNKPRRSQRFSAHESKIRSIAANGERPSQDEDLEAFVRNLIQYFVIQNDDFIFEIALDRIYSPRVKELDE